jgi:hypothetical protein
LLVSSTESADDGTVVLFDGKLPSGIATHSEAFINRSGDLVIETQDLGAALERLVGDADYEWWVFVRAPNKPRVLECLRARASSSADAAYSDARLLDAICEKWADDPRAPTHFQEWLKASGIAYESSSYV